MTDDAKDTTMLPRRSVLPLPVAAIALVLALAAVSCVSLEKGYPERRFFVLDAEADTGASADPEDAGATGNGSGASSSDSGVGGNPGPSSGLADPAATGTVLKVRPFSISDAWSGQEFAYRTDTATWETDYYNTFLIPPAANITDQAQRILATSGAVGQVVDRGSYVEPTHLLEGHVINLHADFRDRAAPHAVLAMQLFLVEVLPAGRAAVRLQKSYEQRVPIDVGEYQDARLGEGIVAGWNTALRRILTDFAREIRESDALVPSSPGG